jgi:hypothetical protein
MHKITWEILIVGLFWVAAGCSPVTVTVQTAPYPSLNPAVTAIPHSSHIPGLSPDELATLNSLERVDEYPLYTMQYYGAYQQDTIILNNWTLPSGLATIQPALGCSLFAAFGDGKDMFYGHNFDWRYSPALLIFTDPPDGHASVSMVDLGYLIPPDMQEYVTNLANLPVQDRQFLLDATAWPFDGMNDQGLVVGMAAVRDSWMLYDPTKPVIDSLAIIRQILDQARNVDEAIAILDSYNIEMGSVPLHYLIADRSGRAALVEFYDEMVVIPSLSPWHLATNHLRVNVPAGAPSGCWRYDRIEQRLTADGGNLTSQQAIDLLQSVSQEGGNPTQWSILYGIDSGLIQIVMGKKFNQIVSFQLDLVQ